MATVAVDGVIDSGVALVEGRDDGDAGLEVGSMDGVYDDEVGAVVADGDTLEMPDGNDDWLLVGQRVVLLEGAEAASREGRRQGQNRLAVRTSPLQRPYPPPK